ncbi:sugar transferase [Nocardioides campestrisoli]|uniref:sugar transferase n=1 Tax=Nocardioides campestrisoli TaxID=2736757 RepID=UPI0015E68FF8|nr:sugar transferase [Nocardioides campestrisoli]
MRSGPAPTVVPRGAQRPLSRAMLAAEIVAVVVAVLVTAVAAGADLRVCGLVGLTAVLLTYVPGRDAVRPGLPVTGTVVRDMAMPVAALGAGAALGWWGRPALLAGLVTVVAAGAVTLVAAGLRRVLLTGVRVVVVGGAADVAEVFARWHGERRIRLVGSVLVEEEQPGEPLDARYAGAEDPREAILRCRPDVVLVLPGPAVDAECVRRIGWALEGSGAGLAIGSGLDGIFPHRIQHTMLAGLSVMQVRSSLAPWSTRAVKAAADRVVASLLLLVLAPVLGFLVALVRATSRGPGLFTQVRVGRDGRPFTLYKLRTMQADAERVKAVLRGGDEGNGLLFKKREDPRVTRIGRLLRKYSLDELPQLINVVRGDMSLIGPRPALPEEVARYSTMEQRRLAVRPGMTGPWQVSGRSTLGRDESMRLDVDYADNYRLCDDLGLALRTVDAVVRPTGAW